MFAHFGFESGHSLLWGLAFQCLAKTKILKINNGHTSAKSDPFPKRKQVLEINRKENVGEFIVEDPEVPETVKRAAWLGSTKF